MSTRLQLTAVLASLLFLTACATTPPRAAFNGPHAECLVCKCNADLACVDVEVDAKTPRTVLNGKTYYFCSEECKAAFEKNAAKYTAKK